MLHLHGRQQALCASQAPARTTTQHRVPQAFAYPRKQEQAHRLVCCQARKQQQEAPTDDAPTEDQQQETESSGFSAIVSRLLHRAASSLTRGQTTCLACAGKGTCTCPACQGTGVTEKDARQNAMRHTAQKLRSVLHVERSEYHSDWLTSNRCRRCHGTGVMLCPNCQGQGVRHRQ